MPAMVKQISVDTALNLYECCKYLGIQKYINFCKEYIARHMQQICMSDFFLDLDKSTLKDLLKFEAFNATEIEMFNACVLWAKRNCIKLSVQNSQVTDLRKSLVFSKWVSSKKIKKTDLIFFIRLPFMHLDEFSEGPAKSGMFNKSEIKFLEDYISGANESDERDKFVSKFVSKERGLHNSHSISFSHELNFVKVSSSKTHHPNIFNSEFEFETTFNIMLEKFFFCGIFSPIQQANVSLFHDSSVIFEKKNMKFYDVHLKNMKPYQYIIFPIPQNIVAGKKHVLKLMVTTTHSGKHTKMIQPTEFEVKYMKPTFQDDVIIKFAIKKKSDFKIFQMFVY